MAINISKTMAIALGIASVAAVATTTTSVSFENVMTEVTKVVIDHWYTLQPGLENEEKNEFRNIVKTAKLMYEIQLKNNSKDDRDAHAKAHGCVQAKFTIMGSGDIDPKYQVGLFAKTGQEFDAIIRFSNGSGGRKEDFAGDGRGMAIKVLNATKESNLLGTGKTQDFMMINAPRFFTGTVHDYLQFQKAVKGENLNLFFLERTVRQALEKASVTDANYLSVDEEEKLSLGLVKFASSPGEMVGAIAAIFPKNSQVAPALVAELKLMSEHLAPLELGIVAEISHPIQSSLLETYHSMSSYLLKSVGDQAPNTAVKYLAVPVDCATKTPLVKENAPATSPEDKNYLLTDLVSKLQENDQCFSFYIQPLPENLTPEMRMILVEDPRLRYSDSGPAPLVQVASVKMPKQAIDSSAKQGYCEGLSYNPWQALPEHQPLGGLNRARRIAVTASSIRRHINRGTQREEPTEIKQWSDLK